MIDERILMKAVKDLRTHMGVSQVTFATRIGKSYAMAQFYEQRGAPPAVELGVFVRLASECGRSDLAQLFKAAILEQLPPDLISVIREPEEKPTDEPTKKAPETGAVHKRRLRA